MNFGVAVAFEVLVGVGVDAVHRGTLRIVPTGSCEVTTTFMQLAAASSSVLRPYCWATFCRVSGSSRLMVIQPSCGGQLAAIGGVVGVWEGVGVALGVGLGVKVGAPGGTVGSGVGLLAWVGLADGVNVDVAGLVGNRAMRVPPSVSARKKLPRTMMVEIRAAAKPSKKPRGPSSRSFMRPYLRGRRYACQGEARSHSQAGVR